MLRIKTHSNGDFLISSLLVDDEEEELFSNLDEDPFNGDIPVLPSRENNHMNRNPMSITRDLRNSINKELEGKDEEEQMYEADLREGDSISIIS